MSEEIQDRKKEAFKSLNKALPFIIAGLILGALRFIIPPKAFWPICVVVVIIIVVKRKSLTFNPSIDL